MPFQSPFQPPTSNPIATAGTIPQAPPPPPPVAQPPRAPPPPELAMTAPPTARGSQSQQFDPSKRQRFSPLSEQGMVVNEPVIAGSGASAKKFFEKPAPTVTLVDAEMRQNLVRQAEAAAAGEKLRKGARVEVMPEAQIPASVFEAQPPKVKFPIEIPASAVANPIAKTAPSIADTEMRQSLVRAAEAEAEGAKPKKKSMWEVGMEMFSAPSLPKTLDDVVEVVSPGAHYGKEMERRLRRKFGTVKNMARGKTRVISSQIRQLRPVKTLRDATLVAYVKNKDRKRGGYYDTLVTKAVEKLGRGKFATIQNPMKSKRIPTSLNDVIAKDAFIEEKTHPQLQVERGLEILTNEEMADDILPEKTKNLVQEGIDILKENAPPKLGEVVVEKEGGRQSTVDEEEEEKLIELQRAKNFAVLADEYVRYHNIKLAAMRLSTRRLVNVDAPTSGGAKERMFSDWVRDNVGEGIPHGVFYAAYLRYAPTQPPK